MMEFLDYEEVSFRPDANIGHLFNNLNNNAGKAVWYDTFQVQNTKWLWLVNNVVAALNSYNMHCGCFGQYASNVAGILNSVKEINFHVLCNKKVYIAQTTLKTLFQIQCFVSFKSHTNNYFVLTSGEEKVVITFESRFLHGNLPSKRTFAYAVLNKIVCRL